MGARSSALAAIDPTGSALLVPSLAAIEAAPENDRGRLAGAGRASIVVTIVVSVHA
ncbi:MAG: hypothetical protein IPL61_39960 [Myxococcales bacterium]|nr:hypothetical protein [Myxococcales bacterium]